MDNTLSRAEDESFNWLVLFLLASSTIILGIIRDGIPALFPFIQAEFELTGAQVGLFSTFLFASSTLVAVFTGRIVDLLGPKRAMILGASLSGLLMMLFSVAPLFSVILFLAFIIGLGISVITPAASKGVMEWFPYRVRATAMGVVQSGIGVGSLLAAALMPLVAEIFHWRTALLVPGVLSLALGIIFYRFYVSPEGSSGTESSQSQEEQESFWEALSCYLREPYFLLISLLGLVLGLSFGATNSHYTLYLFHDHGLTRTVAGLGFGFLHVGAILGRSAWGAISDYFLGGSRRKGLFTIGLSITFFSLILGFFFTEPGFPLPLLFFLSFCMGFTALGFYGLYVTAVGEFVGRKNMGVAMGFTLTFFRGGLLLSPPIFGYIADLRGAYDYSWIIQGVFVLVASTSIFILLKRYEPRV